MPLALVGIFAAYLLLNAALHNEHPFADIITAFGGTPPPVPGTLVTGVKQPGANPAGTKGGDNNTPSEVGNIKGVGARIVAAATARLGKPYRFGAMGPDAYDCSGLVKVCVAEATGGKVNLPHNAAMQMGDPHLRPVKRSSLEPGDLVFFFHPVHHVGIYEGGGKMIDAPHTGAVVRVDVVQSGYVGARRLKRAG